MSNPHVIVGTLDVLNSIHLFNKGILRHADFISPYVGGPFVWGRYVGGPFVWGRYVAGPFVCGRYVWGHFVGAVSTGPF